MSAYVDFLQHHGILGMRWGKRNGPPYPLGASDHSASEKKAGWRKSLDGGSEEKSKSSFRLSDKQKKYLKIGAAVAVAGLAAYGAYKLGSSGVLDGYVSAGRKAAGSVIDISSADEIVTSQTSNLSNGIKRLEKPESLTDTLRNTNPYRGNEEGANNCSLCGIAGFLRRNGYDVKAGNTGGDQQILGGVVEDCFKWPSEKERRANVKDGYATKFGKSPADAEEFLKKWFGDDASGVVSIQWKPNSPNKGGHVFNWEIKDGLVRFIDFQGGRDHSTVVRYWNDINPDDSMTVARLDNAEINIEGIKKWLE